MPATKATPEAASSGMDTLDLHPTVNGVRYTLRGLFRKQEDATRKAESLAAAGLEVALVGLVSPRSTELFAVAAKHEIEPTRRTGIPRRHTTDWEATRMAVEVFRRTVGAASRIGTQVRWYKGLDIAGLHRCLMGINWRGTYLDVSASLLSSMIVAHSFPNANHRTAISLTRLLLGSVGTPWPHFELRGRGIRRFVAASTPFIISSKYLLQVLRHRPMIRMAYEEGFTHLELAGQAVPVGSSDLLANDSDLRGRHLALSNRFVDSLADESGQLALRKPCRTGLADWVAWYQQ